MGFFLRIFIYFSKQTFCAKFICFSFYIGIYDALYNSNTINLFMYYENVSFFFAYKVKLIFALLDKMYQQDN